MHECVFRGDVKELSLLIRKNETDLGLRDPHGNTGNMGYAKFIGGAQNQKVFYSKQ